MGKLKELNDVVDIAKEIMKKDKNIIKVENSLDALYKIASLKRDLNKIPVVAITGSVGKTSTKDLVANVVAQKYKICKNIRGFFYILPKNSRFL